MTGILKIEIECPTCKKSMRIPTDKGHIRFACPDCNTGMEWSPAPTVIEAEAVQPPLTAPTAPTASVATAAPKVEEPSGPWIDISAGVLVSLVALVLIGLTVDIHEIFAWIILLVAVPVAGTLFYSGIKGLWAEAKAKFRTRKALHSKPETMRPYNDGWWARTHFIVAALIVAALNIFIPVLDALPEGPLTITGSILLVGLTGQCIYSVFRAIKLAFGKGNGVSVALTFVAFFFISRVPDALRLVDLDLTSGVALFGREPEDSHFKGVKVENTTPSELDDLMEDW